MYIHIHTYAYTYVPICIHTYIYLYIYICIYMQGDGKYYTQRSAILPSIDLHLRSPILYRVTQWVYIYISISLCLFLNKYILLWIDLDLWSGIHLYIYEYAHLYEFTLCHPSTWILDLSDFAHILTHIHTYERITPPHLNESCHTYECICLRYTCHICECASFVIRTSRMWLCDATHVCETCHCHMKGLKRGAGCAWEDELKGWRGLRDKLLVKWHSIKIIHIPTQWHTTRVQIDTSAYRYRPLNPSRGCQIFDAT